MQPLRALAFATAALLSAPVLAQQGSEPRNDLPQPYTTIRTWGELPPGVKWAAVTAIETAPDGTIYVVHRCFENSCANRPEAPILKYNAAGKLLGAFGQGQLIFPHGGTVDREGNLWMTDAGSAPGKGHQAIKFSPGGKILMTLGKAGVSGSGPDLFDQPTDVVVAPNGDLFITDSHRNGKNNRVMHFTKDGKFIKQWGRKGQGRGELSEPHTIAMDSRGRLFVGDRENNRIVIYNQDGEVLDEWRQFGRPSGIVITSDDTMYVADSESWGTDTGARELPGIKKGIRIGSARDGRVTAFIEDQESTAADHAGAEGVGVDAAGNVYGGVVRRRMLERHVLRQPGAGDWAQWRGPARDGVVPHFVAPAKWPEQLTRRWTVEVGTGHATPLLVRNRVYMFSRRGDNEVLAAFDAATGKELWATGYSAPYTPNRLAADHGQGPKSTPLFVDGRLFTLGISGILSAFDATTGARLWHKPAPPLAPTYSTSQSPLFENGHVIVHVGGYGNGALTSFNPATGAVNWEWTGDGPAYGSPIVVEFSGTRQVITFTENMLVGVSAATGELLWSRPFHSARDVQAITPLVYQDTIIVTAFESGITAIRVNKRDGKWGTDNAWKNDEQYSRFSNAVIVGDAYFALSGKSGGMFMYLDAKTGEVLWKGEPRTAENAAIARAGNILFALKDDGEMVVADGSNPRTFAPLARYQLSDSATWAAPSISGNRLFVKGLSQLTLWTVD